MPEEKQENVVPQSGTAATRTTQESYWRSFPVLERTLGQENPPILKQMEATCRQLDAIQVSGSAAEKARAHDAMKGFARALELYRELVERRDYAFSQSNIGKPRRDK